MSKSKMGCNTLSSVQGDAETKGWAIEGQECVKTSNLLLWRHRVNEVVLLSSSCLLHLVQIVVTCSLHSLFFFFSGGG